MENKPQTTTALDYLSLVGKDKEVTLPSGAVFRIRRVKARELVGFDMPLISEDNMSDTSEEKLALRWSKMTATDKAKQFQFNNEMIKLAVISPKISEDDTDGTLNVRDIEQDDYVALVLEINDYAFGGGIKSLPLDKKTI